MDIISLDTLIASIEENKAHIDKLFELSNVKLDLFYNSQKIRHLYSLGKKAKEIVNVGFNAGYDVLFFLITNSTSKIHCLVNEYKHEYTLACFNYLAEMFPKRLVLYQENSKYLLEYFKTLPIDLVNIHARDDLLASNILFFHFHGVSKNDTVLIWNYSYLQHYRNFWNGYIASNMIEEIPSIEMPFMYSHVVGKVRKDDYKIAVLSLTIGDEYKRITKYMRKSKLLYCKKHGYDFYEDEDIYDTTRPIAWSKIKLILKYINSGYDYLLWLDGDTFVMNDEIEVKNIININMDKKDLMLVEDYKFANSGVMFIKCSEWSKIFFEEVYKMEEFINTGNWEQDAIIHMYETNKLDSKSHIILLSVNFQRLFNSYWYNYQWGDFILHLLGFRHNIGTHLLDYSNRYCPIKMDDEKFVTYLNRLKWLRFECHTDAQKILNNKDTT